MRPLREYDRNDWKRLRPVTHWLKTFRYATMREIHVRRGQQGGDASLHHRIRGRRVLTAIAYNDSEAIEMQVQAVARHVPNALYVVADNSSDDSAADKIAATAAAHNAPYVRLPKPWEKAGS